MNRSRRRLVNVALAAGIGAVALLVRIPGTGEGFTIDERLWIDRADRFVGAVSDGRFGDTLESGHPGVTTMWIAGLAQRTLPDDADLRDRYARARAWMAVVSAALIVLIWWLGRAVVGELAALLGGLLIALDPFVLALNRLVHVDGLLALLMLASALAFFGSLGRQSRSLLLASGVTAGLSLLTKQPAVFLVLVAVIGLWRAEDRIKRFAIWAGAAAVTVVALWPALWVSPRQTISIMAGGSEVALTEGHHGGFFLGEVTGDPGPLFYPVAFAFRASEFILPAVVVTAVWAIRRRREKPARATLILLAFALGLLIVMTVAPKKGDRYILPSFVAIDLAVAVGLAELIRVRGRVVAIGAAAMLALHAAPGLALHPYELSHFNWTAGGPSVAEGAIVVGFGQGVDEAARELSVIPGAASMTVATTWEINFTEFFVGRTIKIEESSLMEPGGVEPDLVLFYISSVQAGLVPDVWERYRERAPFYELEMSGIPYVRVYRV